MFDIFDPVFDLNGDGKMDIMETALYFEAMDEMEKEDREDSDDFDDFDDDGDDW